jgi:mannitol 2-dehydrogenase
MTVKLSSAALTRLPAGVTGPKYKRSDLTAGMVHIGVGNFHRAH